ncbi:MAG TPA: hypothetical protein V6C52_03360 [Coleofasciculaceae cyanobacterium]|jgi:hypothetical protein
MKKIEKAPKKISSTTRLEELLEETESELASLEPQIEKLEKQLDKLKELKLAKQKLITLKLSIKSILSNFSHSSNGIAATSVDINDLTLKFSKPPLNNKTSTSQSARVTSESSNPGELFLPEQAFTEVNTVLRKRTSLNYELFRAIVFKGGKASTEDIKAFLVENNIRQPASGESFEAVELTDISSRVNYLVRKGVVKPDGRGNFISLLGWSDSQNT